MDIKSDAYSNENNPQCSVSHTDASLPTPRWQSASHLGSEKVAYIHGPPDEEDWHFGDSGRIDCSKSTLTSGCSAGRPVTVTVHNSEWTGAVGQAQEEEPNGK